MIADRFGTMRGLVRLLLSYPEVALGKASILKADPATIRRLVFVCHGNICRSAFADVVARKCGLNAISFGLSAEGGKPAWPQLAASAKAFGVDMSAHRATEVNAYHPQPGDLLLAMESRQLRRLANDQRLASVPRTLLGLYCRPPVPHLHDPYRLGEGYGRTCLLRIKEAVPHLGDVFPNSRM